MSIVTNELVYFTGKNERKRDFSGLESAFSPQERLAYLAEYQKQARDWYEDQGLDQQAVEPEQVDAFLKTVSDLPRTRMRRTIRFDTMTAYELSKQPQYQNLHLYCQAKVEENQLVFPGRKIRPTSCALYELKGNDVFTVSMDVWIPEDYRCTASARCGTAQAGRIVELRVGTVEQVKVKFYNTGEICAFSKNMWEPKQVLLGKVRFDQWNSLAITVGDQITVTANGETTEGIIPVTKGKIDGIFFDGGMFPRGTWKVANLAVNGQKLSFDKNEVEEEPLPEGREVSLPYAIGGCQKRDRKLYLVKRFSVDEFEDAVLELETLDPCGKVWINDQLVLDTDTFTRHDISVAQWLKPGENELKILVEPRAPEVYYYWHRHTDCYNGWFCGSVALHLTAKHRIEDLQVRTRRVQPKVSAEATLTLNDQFKGTVRLYAAKCYPDAGEKKLLAEKAVDGDTVTILFSQELALWSDEQPNLYIIRAELLDNNGDPIDDYAVETGFRTICQKDGQIYLNDRKVLLNGALLMQFLPPYEEVPINHNCPTTYQIAWQAMMLKAMNGNLMRLHLLGYGTNDPRFARICDRLGIMLVWTTRLIDTLEELIWDDGCWQEEEAYLQQILSVANYPSIVMYEGSNEFHPKDLAVIDRMYDKFVDGIKRVDDTRLLTPCSHLYYGGGIYDIGCRYYSDDGSMDEKGNPARSGHGWTDDSVIRSTHTYSLLCGYGESWEAMRKQQWSWQDEMLESGEHSYLITEYAVTALPNPNTKEARENPYVESYERPDEIGAIGRWFNTDEWAESQALQALCAFQGIKHMRRLHVDGMTWCCLMSGANNGSYMKPPIDFYGYKKLGFYGLRDGYRPVFACKEDIDLSYGTEESITPMILQDGRDGSFDLVVSVLDQNGKIICTQTYLGVKLVEGEQPTLPAFRPNWVQAGYYTIRCELNSTEEV